MNPERREARARERFFAKVDKGNGFSCWLWTAGKDADGYGVFYYNGRSRRAHRVSLELARGRSCAPLLRHICDMPSCVRPSHLVEGTQAENIADAYARGRKNDRGSANGFSKLTEAQVVEMRRLYGRRGRGGLTQEQLAQRFGVDQTHVSEIVNRAVWRHV